MESPQMSMANTETVRSRPFCLNNIKVFLEEKNGAWNVRRDDGQRNQVFLYGQIFLGDMEKWLNEFGFSALFDSHLLDISFKSNALIIPQIAT